MLLLDTPALPTQHPSKCDYIAIGLHMRRGNSCSDNDCSDDTVLGTDLARQHRPGLSHAVIHKNGATVATRLRLFA